jgi:hypothetical protein
VVFSTTCNEVTLISLISSFNYVRLHFSPHHFTNTCAIYLFLHDPRV